jgi:hypothetical protein
MEKLFLGILLFLVLLIVGGFVFFQWNIVEGAWRYKITVNVETPEGMKSGSAVREISNRAAKIKLIDLPEVTDSPEVSGEAVVVDLGDRGHLFALIDWDSYYEFIKVFPYTAKGDIAARIQYYSGLEAGLKGELVDKKYWPLMVAFEDMNDAKSVVAVYKVEHCAGNKNHQDCNGSQKSAFEKVNRLEEVFGEGVKVKNIIIEVTDEPKTKTGVLGVLPKFDEKFWEWRRALEYSDPRKISGVNFSKGTVK